MVRQHRRPSASASAALLACALTFSACFDTRQIPEGAGSGGKGGASSGNGGAAGKGGSGGNAQAAGAAGNNEAGSSDGGSESGGNSSGGNSATGGSAGGGGANTGGSTTGGARSGGAPGSGGKATGGVTTGGISTGGSASGGSAGQGAKVEWLSFVNSDAPSTLSPNGALGINGVVYGSADSCAVFNWNPLTRCATGTLCNANNGENWGVALVFDFKNTGPSGTPANTKQLWNPNDVGALGVAWEITGSAPALQVWVLNMAPVWNGQCDAVTCEIAGPPDGTAGASLAGQFLFSNMEKDDWGGSGIKYDYDPAKVHALQFKLPAIIAGAASFSFCLKSVGLVR